MPNMCKKTSEKVRYVPKPSKKSLDLRKQKYTIGKMIASLRSRYEFLDKEYYELLDLQAFLMAKKFKLDSAEGDKDKKLRTFLQTSEIKTEFADSILQIKQEEIVNQTKLELDKSLFADDAEEEDDE